MFPEGPIQGLGSICLFCFCLIFQFESFLDVFVFLFIFLNFLVFKMKSLISAFWGGVSIHKSKHHVSKDVFIQN